MSKISPRVVALFAALALLAAACSSSTDVAAGAGGEDGDAATEATAEEEVEEEETETVVPNTEPAIVAGATSTGSVEIGGTTIDYAVTVPADFEVGDEAPVLLAFPPGGQDLALTENIVAGTYFSEAQRLGWVVLSPAAPNGELFFNGSEALVPGLLDWAETWVTPEGGAPHVAGISNGGISSFRYATQNPDRVQSLIAFPGFPRGDDDRAALPDLADVPVRLFVGGLDTNWIGPAEDAVESLTTAGADAELTIFEGEGHVMDSTRDGTVVFELLESFR